MSEWSDFSIPSLGECAIDSPLLLAHGDEIEACFVTDEGRILLDDRVLHQHAESGIGSEAALELAGPRRSIFFDPAKTRAGIVTCGGLCPGINDVIRGLVMVLHYRYGVQSILGFLYGYRGCAGEGNFTELTPSNVYDIHESGGTILGSSRGHADTVSMVDRLVELGIDILFVIGGDGTIRGALAVGEEIRKRGLKISIVGVPKTIDNDILFIDQSFGFETAYSQAMQAIRSAHNESRGAVNGVGVVKLMGRHSGFIACHATLACSHVNFTLIPEVPVTLDGPRGFLAALEDRLAHRQHAVVVVAEGAGQDLMGNTETELDVSGNVKLTDIGPFLVERIRKYFKQRETEVNVKYIDPSYIIRSLPASPPDSVYCWRLAQHAVHAAMCGKTQLVVAQWHGRMVYVPMRQTVSGRKCVDPQGDLWLSVRESTGQPAFT